MEPRAPHTHIHANILSTRDIHVWVNKLYTHTPKPDLVEKGGKPVLCLAPASQKEKKCQCQKCDRTVKDIWEKLKQTMEVVKHKSQFYLFCDSVHTTHFSNHTFSDRKLKPSPGSELLGKLDGDSSILAKELLAGLGLKDASGPLSASLSWPLFLHILEGL